MSSTMCLLIVSTILSFTGVDAVSQIVKQHAVISPSADAAASNDKALKMNLMRSESIESDFSDFSFSNDENDHNPKHIHGTKGHYWRWVPDPKLKWKRVDVSQEEVDKITDANRAAVASESAAKPTDEGTGKLATSVTMEVYYETRCPGCMLFIAKTLEPLYRNQGLRDVLNISMITYGNSMTIPINYISEGYKFWHPDTTGKDKAGKQFDSVQICQHGSDECLGDAVQVCAKEIATYDQHMELIFCMANTTILGYAAEKSTYDCMKQHNIDTQKVKECVRSQHGNDLVNQAGKKTNALQGKEGTPWVMVQGAHVADQLLINGTLLMQSICGHVGNIPIPCAPWKAAPAVAPAAQAAPPQEPDFQVLAKDQDMLKIDRNNV